MCGLQTRSPQTTGQTGGNRWRTAVVVVVVVVSCVQCPQCGPQGPTSMCCKLAPQNRLRFLASGSGCTHLACCNYEQLRAIVATSTHSRKPVCPVNGCASRIRLDRDIEVDDQLTEALSGVPSYVSEVEVRKASLGGPYEIRWSATSCRFLPRPQYPWTARTRSMAVRFTNGRHASTNRARERRKR